MANQQHFEILLQGSAVWNEWRLEHPEIIPDLKIAPLSAMNLSDTNLSETHLEGANLSGASLAKANLKEAHICGARLVGDNLSGLTLKKPVIDFGGMEITWSNLHGADLTNADLTDADLSGAGLQEANFSGCKIDNANFTWANLTNTNFTDSSLQQTDFSGADITGACFKNAALKNAQMENAVLNRTDFSEADMTGVNLCRASMVETIVKDAILDGSFVYGISVWNLQGKPASMNGLIISSGSEAHITVDDLDVAQFIHMLLTREKLRNVIDTITSKAVLILGRFYEERKIVLDALAEELRKRNYLPIIFDFERAKSRDFTETIKILAGMSWFVIADISNPSSSPLELQATVPDYEIPFVPIIEKGQQEFAMFKNLQKFKWVLDLLEYPSLDILLKKFETEILEPALKMNKKIIEEKAAPVRKKILEN